jgi:hypothetical protein
MSQNLKQPTPEQRLLYVAATRAKRDAQKEAAKDFQVPNPGDYAEWKDYARKYGIQMPAWYTPRTKRYMCRYARRLGYDLDKLRDIFGHDWNYEDFALMNPDKSLQYFVGVLLENKS